MRCVRLAEDEAHMTPERAKGFCADRYHAATGKWPGEHHHAGRAAMTAPDYDADGLDSSWDGDHSDLPDLTGLSVPHFEAAAHEMGMGGAASPAGDQAQRAMPKLGTGSRFKKLKASLAAKGAHDPGALAAYIGRRKYGKAAFHKLAAKARGKGGSSRMSSDSNGNGSASRSELMRDYPLEDLHIVRSADGGDGRTMEAFAAVFNTETGIRDHEGEYLEVIEPAAFNKRISDVKRSRPGFGQVKVMFNHGRDMEGNPAERFQMPVAVPVSIEATPRGLLTRSRFVSTPLGEEVLELVNSGAVTAMSFTGRVVRSDPPRPRGGRYQRGPSGFPVVRRLELGLREFGPVLFPAYEGAEINSVRMWIPGSDEPDEEFDPGTSPDGEAAAGEPPADGEHSSRYHQHVLYAMRSRELREAKGLVL